MPEFLALDIGNVCIRIAPERALKALGFRSREEAAGLIAIELEFETGRISEDEFIRRAVRHCPSGTTVSAMREAFSAILVEAMPGMPELVRKLPAQGIQPVFFSDVSTFHLREFRMMFPAAEAVPDGVYSFETGALKPDPVMFAAFERRFGVPLLYTDDREDLIAAARDHGWNARRFTNAADLTETLAGLQNGK